ncbi:MAG: hypothetical protein ABIK09_02260 [Pseudomonadota bacterium]
MAAEDALKRVEAVLESWRSLPTGPTCADFRAVAGGEGIEVGTGDPGAAEPVFAMVPGTSDFDTGCEQLLRPMVNEGVFKSNAFCKADGQAVRCTLMTPTSVPRVLTFVPHGEGLWLQKIEWQRKTGRPIPPDDDDDDLPL